MSEKLDGGHENFSCGPPFSIFPSKDVRWTPRLITWAALLMVWEPAATLRDRLAETLLTLADLFPGRKRPGGTYQGFIKAWIAWSPVLLNFWEGHWRTLLPTVAGKRWLCQGWVPIAADGSRVDLPHTAKNLAAFGCGGKEHSGPSAWLVMLLHLGTNLPWSWKIAKATADERGMFRQMFGLLPKLALVIADAGYTGYDFWWALKSGGHSFLIRVGANVKLLTELGCAIQERAGIVYVWPDRAAKKKQPPLVLRLIVLHDGNSPVYLLTNVLEEGRLSDQQAAEFYRLRWCVELFFRGLKQTLGKRQMRSHAPVQAALELRWSVLGLALLGLWSVQSQMVQERDPGQVSLASALRHLRVVMRDPSKRCRRKGTLQARLAGAVRDGYVRKAAKASGNWPHKKKQRPPGAPKIVPATPEQILRAKAFLEQRQAA